MKNMKLLLATTAILSMGAMAANAAVSADETYTNLSNAVTINMDVAFVHSLNIIEHSRTNFGILLNPMAGQSVTISSLNDTPTLGGGATLAFNSGTNAPKRGSLFVTPTYNGANNDTHTVPYGRYDVVFGASSVDLVNGSEVCGTVTDFNWTTGHTSFDGAEPIYYGATFTVDSSMTASHRFSGKCTGSTTATLVLVDGESN